MSFHPRNAKLCAAVPLVATLISFQTSHADQSFFMGLGDLPGGTFESRATDISGDGSVVAGWSTVEGTNGFVNSRTEAYRWTRETGMVSLGALGTVSQASGISTDGSTIIGETGTAIGSSYNGNSFPFRWTQQSGMIAVPLGSSGIARGVNGDGSVVVGQRQEILGVNTPLRWTESAGTQKLFSTSNTSDTASAIGVSDDGSVILVYSGILPSANFVNLWTQTTGLTPVPPPSQGPLGTSSISGDGKVVVSNCLVGGIDSSDTNRLARWTNETGAILLPPTPDGSVPRAILGGISTDGSVIVGAARGGLYANSNGTSLFIWDTIHGSRSLIDVLINEYGLGDALAGWNTLSGSSFGVSADGRTIYGGGINPAGNKEAWIAHLGTSVMKGDFNRDGALTSADIRPMLDALSDLVAFQSAGKLSADDLLGIGDLNGDHLITNADLQSLLTRLASGGNTTLPVPEPQTLLLAVAGIAILRTGSYSRRKQINRHCEIAAEN